MNAAERDAGARAGFSVTVSTPEAMLALGAAFATLCRGGEVLAIDGELGAGKSVFVRGLAAGLGVDPAIVMSPTFVIMQRYRGRNAPGGGAVDLVHADAYRLRAPALELDGAGWSEAAGERHVVAALEWASRAPEVVPSDAVRIEIEHGDASGDDAPTARTLDAGVALPAPIADAGTARPRRVTVRDPSPKRAEAFARLAAGALEAAAGAATCPICGAMVPAGAATAPFCSPRCRSADLGRWLGERYRVSRPLGADDLEDLGDFGGADDDGLGERRARGPRGGR